MYGKGELYFMRALSKSMPAEIIGDAV